VIRGGFAFFRWFWFGQGQQCGHKSKTPGYR
jgi:hypothetical protein